MAIGDLSGATSNYIGAQRMQGQVGADRKAQVMGGVSGIANAAQVMGGVSGIANAAQDEMAKSKLRAALQAEGVDPAVVEAGPHAAVTALLQARKAKLDQQNRTQDRTWQQEDQATQFGQAKELRQTPTWADMNPSPPTPRNIDPNSPEGIAAEVAREKALKENQLGRYVPESPTARNIDPNSPEGIAAAAARRRAELGVDKEFGAGDFRPKQGPDPYGGRSREQWLADAAEQAKVTRAPSEPRDPLATKDVIDRLSLRIKDPADLAKLQSAIKQAQGGLFGLPNPDAEAALNALLPTLMQKYPDAPAPAPTGGDPIDEELKRRLGK